VSVRPKITALFRYPVKGLSGVALSAVSLTAGEGVPLDRAYAIENGSARFDAQNPKWLAKTNFLQLMQHERLASLSLAFDEADHSLTLFSGGRRVAKGALQTKLGRQMIEQFLSAYMKTGLKGPPRIVHADGHSFTDISAKALHIVNLETVREVTVFDETGRCEAISVDPLTAQRGQSVPAAMERIWGHRHLGVYAIVKREGMIRTGDTITISTVQP
jgi:uncharacterized protein